MRRMQLLECVQCVVLMQQYNMVCNIDVFALCVLLLSLFELLLLFIQCIIVMNDIIINNTNVIY